MTSHLHQLRNAHTRDELVTCWKVFRACEQVWPDRQWGDVRGAFKLRAIEMGLKWKQ